MRNKMIEDGMLSEGVAPSYFIEGLLNNAPPRRFLDAAVKLWGRRRLI